MSTAPEQRRVRIRALTGKDRRFYERQVEELNEAHEWTSKIERAWSVTTLLQGEPKPALPYWSVKEGANFAVDNIAEIASLAKTDRDAAVDLIKRAPWRKRDKAADIGSTLHHVIEARTLGSDPNVPADVESYIKQFDDWCSVYEPEWEALEVVIWHPDESYAGRLDAIAKLGRLDGKRYLLDWKSGSGTYPSHALQANLYARAPIIFDDRAGVESPMPDIDGAAIVRIGPEGWTFTEVNLSDDIYRAGLYCREMYRWLNETSKTAFTHESEGSAR
jgi:hypothetical protein